MAVSPWASHRQNLPAHHQLDGRRLGVQALRPGRGGASLGQAKEQTEDELWEVKPRTQVLLRQEHYPQDGRQTLRLPFCLRSAVAARLLAGGAARNGRCPARSGWRLSCGYQYQRIAPRKVFMSLIDGIYCVVQRATPTTGCCYFFLKKSWSKSVLVVGILMSCLPPPRQRGRYF